MPGEGLRRATAFLTRLPVGAAEVEGASDIERSLLWFPVVGAAVGAALAGVYAGVLWLTSALPAAAVAVAVGVLLTGALHEDGLADTADALGAWEPAEARRILKDPHHGTYGVTALVLVMIVRVAAVSTLGAWQALAVLPAAHALARGASLSLLGIVPSATDAGLGASYAAQVTGRRLTGVATVALLIAAAAIGLWALPAAVLAAVGAAVAGAVGARRIGGMTGDVLGAAEQLAETLVLLLGAAVAAHHGAGLPWWR